MKRIESLQNPKVKFWKKLLTKKGRDKENAFLIEGEHLVKEALNKFEGIREIIIREGGFYSQLDTRDIPVYEVTADIMKGISETVTSQGVFAVCSFDLDKAPQLTVGKYVLLDGIQDPGNMGTIIRTADSAGLDAVILGEGCVDIYNSKVIRSTQGSLFHIPIYHIPLLSVVNQLRSIGVSIFGTAIENGKPYGSVSPLASFGLILGNEGNGVQKDILEQTTENIYIPIYGKAESLNVAVAAGILMYHLGAKI